MIVSKKIVPRFMCINKQIIDHSFYEKIRKKYVYSVEFRLAAGLTLFYKKEGQQNDPEQIVEATSIHQHLYFIENYFYQRFFKNMKFAGQQHQQWFNYHELDFHVEKSKLLEERKQVFHFFEKTFVPSLFQKMNLLLKSLEIQRRNDEKNIGFINNVSQQNQWLNKESLLRFLNHFHRHIYVQNVIFPKSFSLKKETFVNKNVTLLQMSRIAHLMEQTDRFLIPLNQRNIVGLGEKGNRQASLQHQKNVYHYDLIFPAVRYITKFPIISNMLKQYEQMNGWVEFKKFVFQDLFNQFWNQPFFKYHNVKERKKIATNEGNFFIKRHISYLDSFLYQWLESRKHQEYTKLTDYKERKQRKVEKMPLIQLAHIYFSHWIEKTVVELVRAEGKKQNFIDVVNLKLLKLSNISHLSQIEERKQKLTLNDVINRYIKPLKLVNITRYFVREGEKKQESTFIDAVNQNVKLLKLSNISFLRQVKEGEQKLTFIDVINKYVKPLNLVKLTRKFIQVEGKKQGSTFIEEVNQNVKLLQLSNMSHFSQVEGKKQKPTFVDVINQYIKPLQLVNIIRHFIRAGGKKQGPIFIDAVNQNEKLLQLFNISYLRQLEEGKQKLTFIDAINKYVKPLHLVKLTWKFIQVEGKKQGSTFIEEVNQNVKLLQLSNMSHFIQVEGKKQKPIFVDGKNQYIKPLQLVNIIRHFIRAGGKKQGPIFIDAVNQNVRLLQLFKISHFSQAEKRKQKPPFNEVINQYIKPLQLVKLTRKFIQVEGKKQGSTFIEEVNQNEKQLQLSNISHLSQIERRKQKVIFIDGINQYINPLQLANIIQHFVRAEGNKQINVANVAKQYIRPKQLMKLTQYVEEKEGKPSFIDVIHFYKLAIHHLLQNELINFLKQQPFTKLASYHKIQKMENNVEIRRLYHWIKPKFTYKMSKTHLTTIPREAHSEPNNTRVNVTHLLQMKNIQQEYMTRFAASLFPIFNEYMKQETHKNRLSFIKRLFMNAWNLTNYFYKNGDEQFRSVEEIKNIIYSHHTNIHLNRSLSEQITQLLSKHEHNITPILQEKPGLIKNANLLFETKNVMEGILSLQKTNDFVSFTKFTKNVKNIFHHKDIRHTFPIKAATNTMSVATILQNRPMSDRLLLSHKIFLNTEKMSKISDQAVKRTTISNVMEWVQTVREQVVNKNEQTLGSSLFYKHLRQNLVDHSALQKKNEPAFLESKNFYQPVAMEYLKPSNQQDKAQPIIKAKRVDKELVTTTTKQKKVHNELPDISLVDKHLNEIVEKVYKAIERKLSLERKRRGLS